MNLEIHVIKDNQDPYFQEMWELYIASFPIHEIRVHEDLIRALKDNLFQCIAYLDTGKKVRALMHAWNLPSSYYAEFIAIHPDCRGQGLGSEILQELTTRVTKPFLLEIEYVCDEYTAKRWRFYERLGFIQYTKEIYKHPSYQKGFPPFDVTVLSYKQELTDEEYKNFTETEKQIPISYSAMIE